MYLGMTPKGKLYKCDFTKHVCVEKYMKLVAPVLPQSPVSAVIFDSDELPDLKLRAKQARKRSISNFNEMDANCNTCAFFHRLKADNAKGSSSASNFIYGNCLSKDGLHKQILLKREGYQVMVHAADFMGMICWQNRK